MDVSVELIINQSNHFTANEAGRWRNGEIVEVHRTGNLHTVLQQDGTYKFPNGVGSPRTGFIHIRGVPGSSARRMRNLLTLADEEPGVLVRRRIWRVKRGSLPAVARQTLLREKELTVTWDQFKTITHLYSNERALSDGDV